MIPLHFGLQHSTLFGIYDPAKSPRRRIGLLIANPTGWEAIRAHRALRLLAMKASEKGFDVLRFDFMGTGDSLGDESTHTAEQALLDIEVAVEELTSLAGVSRIVLVGVRVGARIALEAARRGGMPVERIVLWDPVSLESPEPGTPRSETDVPDSENDRHSLAHPLSLVPHLAAQLSHSPLNSRVRVLILLSLGQLMPFDLTSISNLVVDSESAGAPCWIEEHDNGAGAAPVHSIDRIVSWLES